MTLADWIFLAGVVLAALYLVPLCFAVAITVIQVERSKKGKRKQFEEAQRARQERQQLAHDGGEQQ